ncbi:hypothetical protein GCM10020331_030050 [Ectobacillus funiculus]
MASSWNFILLQCKKRNTFLSFKVGKGRREGMFHILVIAVIVVIVVLFFLSVVTINKGYSYKHSVDRAEDSPYVKTRRG